MSIDDFMQGIHILQNNYNRKFSKEQLKLYYENLKDMSAEKYIANINRHIKSNTFMPNIAEIRDDKKREIYSNYEQRDYSNIDLEKFYAN